MVDNEEIRVPSLSSRLPETLFQFQQKRYLCDVMIITANGFIPAHRVVLVAGSQYFYESDTTRNSVDPTDPNFHLNYDIEDVRKVVNLLYTGKMTISKFNVERIAAICAELKITEALEKCLVYMTEVGVSNHVMMSFVDLPEKSGQDTFETNFQNDASIENHVLINTLSKETEKNGAAVDSKLKRKLCSDEEVNDTEKSQKRPKRANNKKGTKNKNKETKTSNADDTKKHAGESVITIQPFLSDNESNQTRDSIGNVTNQSENSNQISYSSSPDLSSAKTITCPKEEPSANSETCMFIDFNDLQVYQKKVPAAKLTKQFDPDGAITEAMEKDQEFLDSGQVEKRLNCRKCKMVFKDVESLTEHRREIHPSNFKKQRFVCDICNAKPNNRPTLVEHKFKKHGIPYDKAQYPIYKCQEGECEFETIVPYKLSEHKTTVHSGLACICETCGRAFKSKSVLKYHIQSNHSESRPTFICNTCGKTYFTAQALKKHMEYHTGTQKRLLCHLCPYSSVGRQELNNHLLKLHNVPVPKKTKVYQCEKCDYYSLNRTQFRRHIAMHDGRENAYKCSECDKAFPSIYNLKSHEKRHKAETIKCPHEGCNFFTKFKHILKNHISGKHTNTNFKPYKCHLCEHSCKLKGNLNKHLVNKHGLEVMTEVKQRKIALETGQGYTEILLDRAKSRIANTIPAMFPQEES